MHAVQWRSMDSLQSLLTCSGHLGSTLYYRMLDMPLAEWESMKTVKVWTNDLSGQNQELSRYHSSVLRPWAGWRTRM